MKLRLLSLSRTFALLSLLIIALITLAQVWVQWALLRRDLVDWERTVTADKIRAEAYPLLRPGDFVDWRNPRVQERLAQVFGLVSLHPEILRIKVYDVDMRVIWSDEPRLLGTRFPENAHLAEALRGETVALLERAGKSENLYERQFAETVELYVPVRFPHAGAAGPAPIAGVVEIYKSPAPALANLSRDRWTIMATSLGGALLLYAVLFGIVHRASRQLRAQREDLERQTVALSAANRELRVMHDQLRAAERLAAIGEVTAAVAHGIRNPLANIRAASQVALDARSDPAMREKYLGSITAEVDRLGRWLRSLLDSARPFELHPARMELGSLIDDALTVLGDRIDRGQVRVERDLGPDLPPLTADEVQLQQAFLSVLENALDALPPGGTLTVRAESADVEGRPHVRVSVIDTGDGIAPDRLARIFEPFYTTKAKGTGLGLAIARKIVEGHGGTVDLTSEPGKGTAVRITLPVGAVAREAA